MIAIIGCKASKQDYECSADEMYSKGWIYRAQRDFIKVAYSEYYILSSKYGLIKPTTIISPYNTTLYNEMDIKAAPKLKNQNQFWDNVNKALPKGELHFHTSKKYTEGITRNIRHIKQQVAFGATKIAYNKALEMYNGNNIEECLEYIQKKQPSKYNEQAKWFTHPEHDDFFGKATQLVKAHSGLDIGNAYQMSTGRTKSHKQWRIKHI